MRFSAHAVEAVTAALKLFYNCFSALGGRRAGVCISADSAAGEADALINIGAEHAQGFPPVYASAAAAAAAAALAGEYAEPGGRCNSFRAVCGLSADSAVHSGPIGRCNNFLEGVRAQFWASVRHFEKLDNFCHFSVF